MVRSLWRTCMVWGGLVLLLCLGSTVGWAAQIVPEHVETPGGFGPSYPWVLPPGCTFHYVSPTAVAIDCPVAVPATVRELAGWSGYTIDLGVGAVNYLAIEVWHVGQVPHQLDHPHYWPPGGSLATVFFPAGDGHTCHGGDQVFARFWCVGHYAYQGWCAAGMTAQFRVAE